MQGTVRSFNFQNGYGFIRPDGYAEDVFVHRSSISTGELEVGERVHFELGHGRDGRRCAVRCMPMAPTNEQAK